MFSGIQEIVLIALIVLGIFFIPRILKPRPPEPKIVVGRPALPFSWQFRLAIVLSILWPAAWAVHLKPWQHGNTTAFAIFGIGPVIVGWSLKWVLAGMKNRR